MSRTLRTEKQSELNTSNIFSEDDDITLNYDADDIMADIVGGGTNTNIVVIEKTLSKKSSLGVPTPLSERVRSLSPLPKPTPPPAVVTVPGPIIEEKKQDPIDIAITSLEEDDEDEDERELRLKIERKKKKKQEEKEEAAKKKKEEEEVAEEIRKQKAIKASLEEELRKEKADTLKREQEEEHRLFLEKKKKKEQDALDAGMADLIRKNKICEEEEAIKRKQQQLHEPETTPVVSIVFNHDDPLPDIGTQEEQAQVIMDIRFQEEINKVGERINSAPSSPALKPIGLEVDTTEPMEDFLPKTPLHGVFLLHSPSNNKRGGIVHTGTPATDEALFAVQQTLIAGFTAALNESREQTKEFKKMALLFDQKWNAKPTSTTEKPKAPRKRKTPSTEEKEKPKTTKATKKAKVTAPASSQEAVDEE